MSIKPKQPAADPVTGLPIKTHKPRKPKTEGKTNRVVTDVAGDEVLVLNCTSEEQAIQAVTGKYTTRIIGISDAVRMAQKQGARVIDMDDPAPAQDSE